MGENEPSAASAAQPGKNMQPVECCAVGSSGASLGLRVGACSAVGCGSVSTGGDVSLHVFWGKEEIHLTHFCNTLLKKTHCLNLGGRGKV